MRFSAILGDYKTVEAFSKLVHIVSRLCRKRCSIRLTQTEFSFVNAYNAREGRSLDLRISQNDLFASYIFDGVSTEHNSVIFEMSMEDFAHSISNKENLIKIKLSQRNGSPHLVLELKTSCITHEIPIEFVLVRNWHDYRWPIVGAPSVGISLPNVRVMHRVMSTLKNMGTRTVWGGTFKYLPWVCMIYGVMFDTIKANNAGELSVSGVVDTARAELYIHDLPNVDVTDGGSQSADVVADEFFDVSVDMAQLHSLMSSVHTYFSRVTLKIVHGQAAIFTAKQPDCQLTFCIGGLTEE